MVSEGLLTRNQENQDLKELQTMVEDFENQRHKTFVDHALESPVHVMVKFPCIALRYPKSLTLVSSEVIESCSGAVTI